MAILSYILFGGAANCLLAAAAAKWADRWPKDGGVIIWMLTAILWPVAVPAMMIRMALEKNGK